jgi:hypothetical protein
VGDWADLEDLESAVIAEAEGKGCGLLDAGRGGVGIRVQHGGGGAGRGGRGVGGRRRLLARRGSWIPLRAQSASSQPTNYLQL